MPPRTDAPVSLSNPHEPSEEGALDEFETFCQSQIYRVKRGLEDLPSTNQAVGVTPVRHAVGKRKPSLSQVEMEGQFWSPSLRRKM